jgi:hypothetical protein
VATVGFTMRYASVSEWWATTRAMGQIARLARIDDEQEWLDALAAGAAEWIGDDGTVEIPARTWVAAATG